MTPGMVATILLIALISFAFLLLVVSTLKDVQGRDENHRKFAERWMEECVADRGKQYECEWMLRMARW